jgi:hypothetical protein
MFKNGKRNKFEVIIAYARFFLPAEASSRETKEKERESDFERKLRFLFEMK